jgi:prevent-host-death family protein
MKQAKQTGIGVSEAKTHLSALLKRVELGESFVITRHGHPVAELTALRSASADSHADTWRRIDEFRANHTLGGLPIRDLIDEGRS